MQETVCLIDAAAWYGGVGVGSDRAIVPKGTRFDTIVNNLIIIHIPQAVNRRKPLLHNAKSL